MLKFLDNRINQKEPKSPKKYQPEFLYGNSFQCPKQFQTTHTLFHKPSYINPYLHYETSRLQKIPSSSQSLIEPKWKKKVDLQSIQEQKILSSNPDFVDYTRSKYLSSFHGQFNKDHNRFRKSKGQFTSFIEKNDKFKNLGPLHGDHRDGSRINETKLSVWLKSSKSTFENSGRTWRNSVDRTNLSIRSSISKNSELLTEKHRIRQNRERIYKNYQKSLEKRKFDKDHTSLFQLPKNGPEHQLTFLHNTNYNFPNRYSMYDPMSESEEMYKDLDRFEMTVSQKIK